MINDNQLNNKNCTKSSQRSTASLSDLLPWPPVDEELVPHNMEQCRKQNGANLSVPFCFDARLENRNRWFRCSAQRCFRFRCSAQWCFRLVNRVCVIFSLTINLFLLISACKTIRSFIVRITHYPRFWNAFFLLCP